jgi:hypothetical protein
MISIPFNMPIVKERLKQHSDIKNIVLEMINTAESSTDLKNDTNITDNITRYDWPKGNTKRKWSQFLKLYLDPCISNMLTALGFETFKMDLIWFQQYVKGSAHGWHIHGANYVGVYYLELGESEPPTQFLEPSDKDFSLKTIDAKEGDIILFPSSAWHRGPTITSDSRKTIVSWNMHLEDATTTIKKNYI